MREGSRVARLSVWYPDMRIQIGPSVEEWIAIPDGIQIVRILYDKERKGRYLQEMLPRHRTGGCDYFWRHPDAEVWENSRAREIPADLDPRYIKAGSEIGRAAWIALYNEALQGTPWP